MGSPAVAAAEDSSNERRHQSHWSLREENEGCCCCSGSRWERTRQGPGETKRAMARIASSCADLDLGDDVHCTAVVGEDRRRPLPLGQPPNRGP